MTIKSYLTNFCDDSSGCIVEFLSSLFFLVGCCDFFQLLKLQVGQASTGDDVCCAVAVPQQYVFGCDADVLQGVELEPCFEAFAFYRNFFDFEAVVLFFAEGIVLEQCLFCYSPAQKPQEEGQRDGDDCCDDIELSYCDIGNEKHRYEKQITDRKNE